jgi:malyl-CoA/(S)-citramalyl-CoA lyase
MDKARLHWSELAVPGTNVRAMEKAATLDADVVFLDLEDAVAPDDKERARRQVIDALTGQDWSRRAVSVRINALDTHWCYRDVVDVVEEGGHVLDTVLVPKVGRSSDVEFVATLLDQIEAARGFQPGRIGIHILIETAAGMANVESIAGARPDRLEAMVFGVADYAASVQARTTNIGGTNPDYPGDQWHFALSRMTVACRAYGLRPIDGPFGDFSDPAGYTAGAKRAAALGIEGKWAIHPSQIELANDVFSPTAKEVERAERILVALKEAEAQGKGAASLDGKMIDAASEKMAKNLLATSAAIKASAAARKAA